MRACFWNRTRHERDFIQEGNLAGVCEPNWLIHLDSRRWYMFCTITPGHTKLKRVGGIMMDVM